MKRIFYKKYPKQKQWWYPYVNFGAGMNPSTSVFDLSILALSKVLHHS